MVILLWLNMGQAEDRPCKTPDPRVIDSAFIPEYHFTGKESSDALLPVYCLGADTWMLMGSIELLTEKNRGFNGNAGFVVTPEGVVVIDTLGTPQLGSRMIETIRSVTGRPIRYVIITHNHPDHYYGVNAFRAIPGVEIITHQGLKGYIESDRMEQSVAYRREMLEDDMVDFAGVAPDIVVTQPPYEAYHFSLGGRKFAAYNTGRHHSDGDLLVHQVDEDIVWASDLVFNQRVTFIGEGDSKQALAGLDWLEKHFSDAALMVPGHGSAQTAPFPMLEQTRSYIDRLRKIMIQAIEEDVDLSDALDRSDLEDWRKVRLYEVNHRANGSFIYRELEQELF